ncbi:hypothetical protein M434DRAFT_334123 [Hypoxylon sp. CO27-5]|nr:hypothetical protein M434DRAFT_334123 [Hypoxylon sp. CO27-5]
MRTDPWQRRTHRSFRQMTESSLDTSRVRRGSRETQYDAAHSPDRSVWGEAPDWQSPVISKHRRISQNAHWEPDAVALDAVHGDAHHTNHHASNHPREMLPGVKEPHHEDRHGRSHKDKHHLPIPPKAPKIPRLPTPDFDDVDYGKDNMTNHQFCACCNDDASFEKKSKRRECAVAKMERQGMLHSAHRYAAPSTGVR